MTRRLAWTPRGEAVRDIAALLFFVLALLLFWSVMVP